MLRQPVLRLAVAALLTAAVAVIGAGRAGASDSPAHYYYGSDSNAPTVAGRHAAFSEPGTGGLYGSYTGEIGTWTNWQGCTRGDAFDLADVRAVNANESVDRNIPGLSLYWFMSGPGGDPHYNGRAAEAYNWGRAQAERAGADYVALAAAGIRSESRYVPMMYMDIEGQPAAGYANGWNEIVNSCGQITRKQIIQFNVDRATFDGFYDYIHRHTVFRPGVYSTPDFWNETFGTGPDGYIPNVYEWTPENSTQRTSPQPVGFVQGSLDATWFGGVAASREVGWQWTQNGGDWDQMDAAHLP